MTTPVSAAPTTNPAKSRVLPAFFGVLSGVVFIGVIALSSLWWVLVRDLPDRPAATLAERASRGPSRILAADGSELAEFALVESTAGRPAGGTLPAEAYLGLLDGGFYEPRSRIATPVPVAVVRAARGSGSSASPLSRALAHLALDREPRGFVRRVREDMLATRLDSRMPLEDRVLAWMDSVPLCDGRRGIRRAMRECLGVEPDEADEGVAVLLAAAAAYGVDLGAEEDLLRARAAAVVDQLVMQKRLDPGAGPELLDRALARRPRRSADAVDGIAARARRAYGMDAGGEPIELRTEVLAGPQKALRSDPATEAGAWLVLDPLGLEAVALGGAIDRPLSGVPPELAAWAGGRPEPSLRELALGLATGVAALNAASIDRRPAERFARVEYNPVQRARLGDRNVARPDSELVRPVRMSPEEVWTRLATLPTEGPWAVVRSGDFLAFAHPERVGVIRVGPGASADGLRVPGGLAPEREQAGFPVPDGVRPRPVALLDAEGEGDSPTL